MKKGGQSELKLIKRCAEFIPKEKRTKLKSKSHIRGIYVLFNKKAKKFDVVYIGMALTKMGRRINRHALSKRKGKLWTHFSLFEVWENIRDEEVKELEGIIRHIYRKDSKANTINKQRRFKKLIRVRDDKIEKW